MSEVFFIGPGGNRHDQPSAIPVRDDANAGDDESVEDEELPSSHSKPSKTKKLDKEELPTSGNGQVYKTKTTNEIKKRRSKIASQRDDDDEMGETTTQSEVEDGEMLPNQQKSSEKPSKRLKPKKRKVSA